MTKEKFAELKKLEAKYKAEHPEEYQQEKSLARKITDSSLYDWHPSARFLLVQIAVLAMEDDSNYPEDAPKNFREEKDGWCWMSQRKLALKVGMSESQVQKLIKQFREDGVVLYRDWYDNNKTHHAEYKIVEETVDVRQRPTRVEDAIKARKPRYQKKHTTPGAFKKGHEYHPKKKAAIAGENGE